MIKTAKIIATHPVSIRMDVDDPELLDETIGELKPNATIQVDPSITFWSWKDVPYYKCYYGKNKEGYICQYAVEVIE